MPTNALSEVVVLQLTVRAAPQRIGQPGPSGMPIAYHAMNNSVQATVSTSVYGIISAITVQLVLSWTSHEHLIERRTVNDITGLSLDILVAAAIGTLSLTILGANIPSILILTALSVAWSVTGLLWLGPRLFAEHWFDRAIADYGQSQGNVATGFILAEMADPAHTKAPPLATDTSSSSTSRSSAAASSPDSACRSSSASAPSPSPPPPPPPD
jgi:hypothetical protein